MNDMVGRPLSSKYCRDCAQVISSSAASCPGCGATQSNTTIALNGRNRMVAAVLALLLGGFGIHKFYLGKSGQGIIYLLFFWTFIPAIVAFIEAIIYLTDSDESFERKYG